MIQPRFRFSLRALLIALALVSLWLGWNASIVRYRSRLLRQLEAQDATVRLWTDVPRCIPGNRNMEQAIVHQLGGELYPPSQTMETSFTRRVLGDKSLFSIKVDSGANTQELLKTFPEARIVVFDE